MNVYAAYSSIIFGAPDLRPAPGMLFVKQRALTKTGGRNKNLKAVQKGLPQMHL